MPARLAATPVPMLKPVILFTTITSTIGTLQLFDSLVNTLLEAKQASSSVGYSYL